VEASASGPSGPNVANGARRPGDWPAGGSSRAPRPTGRTESRQDHPPREWGGRFWLGPPCADRTCWCRKSPSECAERARRVNGQPSFSLLAASWTEDTAEIPYRTNLPGDVCHRRLRPQYTQQRRRAATRTGAGAGLGRRTAKMVRAPSHHPEIAKPQEPRCRPSRKAGAPPAIHTSLVCPGMATGATASVASQSSFAGRRFSVAFKTCSHVTSWPVYAAVRPRMAVSVLSATCLSSL